MEELNRLMALRKAAAFRTHAVALAVVLAHLDGYSPTEFQPRYVRLGERLDVLA